MKPSTIAVDGPAASGKSTVGEFLARLLGYLYFDTGAMYRAVTCVCLDRRISTDDEAAVTELAESVSIEITPPTEDDGRQYTVLVDGEDVTWAIRSPAVNANVSQVSAYAGVRTELVRQQRQIASGGRVVMAGRDIGTVVLPNADLKIFLVAGVEERAQRRWHQLQMRGEEADLGQVLASLQRRDEIDSHRKLSPLRPADDACVLDTTGHSIKETLAKGEQLVEGSAA
ncbi:MAG: (d)CMP kinase [Anaerolineales bacterium]|nr:MAG: (d)CMP kinase [Anaerolineales bacterium]